MPLNKDDCHVAPQTAGKSLFPMWYPKPGLSLHHRQIRLGCHLERKSLTLHIPYGLEEVQRSELRVLNPIDEWYCRTILMLSGFHQERIPQDKPQTHALEVGKECLCPMSYPRHGWCYQLSRKQQVFRRENTP